MRQRLVLLAASLAMVLAPTAALAQTEPDGLDEEVRCLLPEGCGPVSEDELLCFLPEGCDTNGDGVPELRAGESVLDEWTGSPAPYSTKTLSESRSAPYQASNVAALSAPIPTFFAPCGEILPAIDAGT